MVWDCDGRKRGRRAWRAHLRFYTLAAASLLLLVRLSTAVPLGVRERGKTLRAGAREGAGWGAATGGVPTREEIHAAFPPIPINVSVPPVVLVPGIGGSILSDVKSGLQVHACDLFMHYTTYTRTRTPCV